MTQNGDDRARQLGEALAGLQREARLKQDAAIDRQLQVDEALADHLARPPAAEADPIMGLSRLELPLLDAIANGRATEWSGWSLIEPTLIEIEFTAGGLTKAMAAHVTVTETPEAVRVALIVGRRPEYAGKILAGRGHWCKVRVSLPSPLDGRELRAG